MKEDNYLKRDPRVAQIIEQEGDEELSQILKPGSF